MSKPTGGVYTEIPVCVPYIPISRNHPWFTVYGIQRVFLAPARARARDDWLCTVNHRQETQGRQGFVWLTQWFRRIR